MTDRRGRSISGILFDVDGTLVDTNYLHAVAWWQAFRQQQLDVPMVLTHRAVGMGSDRLVDFVLEQAGVDADPDQDEMATAHDAIYSVFWPALRPLPGAQELIRHCHAAGLTTVLASSASDRELAVLQRVLDCDDAIDITTGKGDAGTSKPAPDIVDVALRKSGLAVADALFVGDSVWDVKASVQLELPCIGLECGGTSAAELLAAGAITTYPNPRELLAHREEWLTR